MNLTKQFFLGGNATFTVENGKGSHHTFKVRQPKPKMPFFVSYMVGRDNERSFKYLGMLHPIMGAVIHTRKSNFQPNAESFRVAHWAIQKVWSNGTLPIGYKIRHEGKCGCCNRKLTSPDSLDRGIGPECWNRAGR